MSREIEQHCVALIILKSTGCDDAKAVEAAAMIDRYYVLGAAPPPQAALPGRGEIETALCKSHGTAQCAAICLSHFASSTTNGQCPEKKRVYKRQTDAILALLSPRASEGE